jgi:predicted Co/Zn/Cd cation transporter (cation efflux family)
MPYPRALEQQMKHFFDSLSEKDRRRYAAVEAAKLGQGGQEYIAQLFALDPKTVRRGLDELDHLPDDHPQRVRQKGADAGAASTSSPNSSRPSSTS